MHANHHGAWLYGSSPALAAGWVGATVVAGVLLRRHVTGWAIERVSFLLQPAAKKVAPKACNGRRQRAAAAGFICTHVLVVVIDPLRWLLAVLLFRRAFLAAAFSLSASFFFVS
jgi:hypothetical protein